ncbi:hypothetical protein BURMUCF1_3465 [Burkholderia multivorans ATCC BAA-247]|uniref:Uncharacterized protein n=1 Tax=Burkholderia multivorans CGD2 TaxID=513052 RepID=B9C0B2_9BURK|nr:hypothetical protein BURMUCGD2_0099 [Burkholderia multivorans CGD2]EEE10341.1 hypothetical protein BURMUCGD2M_0099 [Burkholderia multivorans CGD2M]EJO63492.1 hypothetical protein BURMUCF1_3465 [Burkholderia multivorans ATCC BAA-247]
MRADVGIRITQRRSDRPARLAPHAAARSVRGARRRPIRLTFVRQSG